MSATARRLLLLVVILIGAWISRPDAQYQITGSGGILSILLGGTGQTTASAAFDALAPTHNNGELIVRTSLTNTALYVGSVNTVLQSDGSNPSWQTLNAASFTGQWPIANGGTGQATQTAAYNALAPCAVHGNIVYYTSTSWSCLGVGAIGQRLATQGASTDPSWSAQPAGSGQLATGGASGFNPTVSTTYYIGTLFGVAPGTTDDTPAYYIGKNATLVSVLGRITVAGTLATSGNSTLVIRNHRVDGSFQDILTVSSTTLLTTAAVEISNTGNSLPVLAGDRLYMKFITPASWGGTSPTAVFFAVTLYFEVP